MTEERTRYGPGRYADHDMTLAELFRQSLSFVRRHLWRIVILGLLCACATLYAALNMERLYKSSAQLMIERPATNPIEEESPTFPAIGTSYVDGQILVIEADDTLLKVIERADLTSEPFFQSKPPNYLDLAVRYIKQLVPSDRQKGRGPLPSDAPDPAALSARKTLDDALTVSREGETNVITIDVRANSPKLAHRVTQAVVATYVDLRINQRRDDALQMSAWIGARAEELRQEVEIAEKAVTDFRVKHGLIGEADGASLSDQQSTELNAELVRARSDLALKRAAYERAQALLDGGGDILDLPEVQSSEILTELRQQLLQVELRERDLSATSRGDNARLDQVRQIRAAIERQIDRQVRRIVNVLGNEVETLENRTRLLSEALLRASGQSKIEIRNNVDLQQLERVAEAYRLRYETYLNNAGLAEELSSFSTSGTQVVTSATTPLEPVYPPVRVFVIFGFMFGALIAVLWGLAREALDTTVRTVAQIEGALGVQILVQLPKLDKRQAIPAVIEEEPLSPFTETVAALRYSVSADHQGSDTAPVIYLASTAPLEGKTSIAASLATSGSVAGQRVLLIDGDLRRAGLSDKFGLANEIGLADILLGAGWQSSPNVQDGVLDVLPAGILTDMPINALESPHLAAFLEQARSDYDLIVIDGPPAANVADCAILSRHSDRILFVVRWGQTQIDGARRALARLPRKKLAGVVLNFSELNEDPWLGETYRLYGRSGARTARKSRSGKVTSLSDWGRRA
ncbi:Tyrosine-protein kinase etk [Falsiruegeria litorea R37]|uniref:non-specific protein-tyrosine kinase n=1 Tax=Falsiruegeria litorea R37 TaxID=1200284 RepID=A0A1Y5RWY8_9RHOB|nr:AAA family ATPase [Falsiruegeria litorea]SLN26888.1 Tyrosine-protein kinase etk [Falsiruegeria litorea R37]